MKHGGKREGAGRKTKYDSQTKLTAFRIPIPLLKTIERYAKKHNLSRSEAIVKALLHYFNKG